MFITELFSQYLSWTVILCKFFSLFFANTHQIFNLCKCYFPKSSFSVYFSGSFAFRAFKSIKFFFLRTIFLFLLPVAERFFVIFRFFTIYHPKVHKEIIINLSSSVCRQKFAIYFFKASLE
jgi:hypothetical protein